MNANANCFYNVTTLIRIARDVTNRTYKYIQLTLLFLLLNQFCLQVQKPSGAGVLPRKNSPYVNMTHMVA